MVATIRIRPAPAAPTIAISAQSVDQEGGGKCLQFYAIPAENLVLISVSIKNPLNDSQTFPLNGATVAANLPVSLQDAASCYIQTSGTYTFTFTGNRPGAAAFTTVSTHTQT